MSIIAAVKTKDTGIDVEHLRTVNVSPEDRVVISISRKNMWKGHGKRFYSLGIAGLCIFVLGGISIISSDNSEMAKVIKGFSEILLIMSFFCFLGVSYYFCVDAKQEFRTLEREPISSVNEGPEQV